MPLKSVSLRSKAVMLTPMPSCQNSKSQMSCVEIVYLRYTIGLHPWIDNKTEQEPGSHSTPKLWFKHDTYGYVINVPSRYIVT